jgi:AcrR family transcriptional regulator
MSSPELDTRERILKATLQLLEKHQGQGVRIEDIAQMAGVSRQAVYLHFGTRPALLIATARYLDDVLRLSERIQRTCSAPNGVEALDAYVEFWANYIPDIYGLAKALMAVRETDEAAAAAWEDRMGAVYGGCLSITQSLARDGLLAPGWTADSAADFFFAALSLPTWETLTTERGWTKEQYIARTQRALKRAFLCTD